MSVHPQLLRDRCGDPGLGDFGKCFLPRVPKVDPTTASGFLQPLLAGDTRPPALPQAKQGSQLQVEWRRGGLVTGHLQGLEQWLHSRGSSTV